MIIPSRHAIIEQATGYFLMIANFHSYIFFNTFFIAIYLGQYIVY